MMVHIQPLSEPNSMCAGYEPSHHLLILTPEHITLLQMTDLLHDLYFLMSVNLCPTKCTTKVYETSNQCP